MSFGNLLDPTSGSVAADATSETESMATPSGMQAQALTGVLSVLGDMPGVPVLALTRANVTSSMELDLRDRADHLARIEEEQRVAVARAKAVVAARQLVDAAYAKVGSDQYLGCYDIEDAAWEIAQEDPHVDALAAQRQAALNELREDEVDDDDAEGAGGDPDVTAVHARYDLAGQLVEVLRELQKTDRGDLDMIVSDLKDRLLQDGETLDGAERDLARTVTRYRVASALRVTVEAYGRLVKKHVSAWPSSARDAEEQGLRAIVFGEGA